MGAVRLLSSIEIRRRARNLVLITLLVAVVGAVVMATAAGARRSATALNRFDEYSRTSTLEIDIGYPSAATIAEFARTPGIEGMALLNTFAMSPTNNSDQATAATPDGALGTIVDRPRLISGRLANPDRPDEVAISEGYASTAHAKIGDHIDATSLTPAQVKLLLEGQSPGDKQLGPKVQWTIVGITRRPLDLGDVGASGGVLILTPAFIQKYDGVIGGWTEIVRVRTRPDAATLKRVTAVAQQMFGSSPVYSAKDLAIESHGARDAINVITLALWIFAAIAAAAGAVSIAIVLAREVANTTPAQTTLRSLGMTRGQRFSVAAPGAVLIAVFGALFAVVGAFLLSPLLPVGIARRSDPNPGLHADWVVLLAGALAIVVLVTAVATFAAWRATVGVKESRRRQPKISEAAARAGCSPAFTSGLNMALQPGRGERAVPIRSAFLATAAGVLGITAVLVYSTSLDHVISTPRLFGWTFDVRALDFTSNSQCDNRDFGVAGIPGITDVAAICYEQEQVDGTQTNLWAFTPIRGSIGPAVVSGRAPANDNEADVGTATLRALHKQVGDTVEAEVGDTKRSFHVVGVAVFPRLVVGDLEPLNDGLMLTSKAYTSIEDRGGETRAIVARYAPHADRNAIESQINAMKDFRENGPEAQVFFETQRVTGADVPPEIDRLRHIAWFPPTLIALLVALATIAVGHALITSVRRRRGDLALLKTLGFERRQLRATVAYQATTIVLVGLALGIPAGILVGRFAWRITATGLGIVPGIAIPVAGLVVVALGAIVVVNLLGQIPAASAARTSVAAVLRSE
jgi:ABC-type antimicrobial peptide transport system permease subunit